MIRNEIKGRITCYLDDWTQTFQSQGNFFKVLAATVFIFFTSVAPAVTFASFLTTNTNGQYGTIDVLISTGVNGLLYSIFAGQPLIIVGVTGPVSIFLETLYHLNEFIHTDFLSFVFWIGFWAFLIHTVLGMNGACSLVKYVTPYTCEVFSTFVGCIYVYTAIRQIVFVFVKQSIGSGLLVIIIASLTLIICHWGSNARSWKAFTVTFRGFIADYAIPLAIIFVTSIYQIPVFRQVSIDLLPTSLYFGPSNGRSTFLVNPMDTSLAMIFAAILPAIILTVLVFFDHNVSALLAQQQFGSKLKKPTAYNWDFILIGILMAVTGLFGLPFTHGLIPQAPLHVRALTFKNVVEELVVGGEDDTEEQLLKKGIVVEQRVSNFVQSILTICLCTSNALLLLLSSIPVAALNGLFLYFGLEALMNNAFAARLYSLFFVTELEIRVKTLFWPVGVEPAKIWFFVLTQFIMLVIIFAITVSPLAILFPFAITLTVCIRLSFGRTWFWNSIQMNEQDLLLLDGDFLAVETEVIESISMADLVIVHSS